MNDMKHPKLHQKLKMLGCSTIGDFERLAGLNGDEKTRFKFWIQHKNLDSKLAFENGIQKLITMIHKRIKRGDLCLLPNNTERAALTRI